MEEKNFLNIALKIKEWIENSPEKALPSRKSDDKEEKELAKELNYIRKKLIKPYQKLKKEKDIKKFEEKHPDIYEIANTIQKIDESIIVHQINKAEENIVEEKEVVDLEIENIKNIPTPEFEYDKENEKQSDLVELIVKDIKLDKTIEEANKLKEKYKKEEKEKQDENVLDEDQESQDGQRASVEGQDDEEQEKPDEEGQAQQDEDVQDEEGQAKPDEE